MMSVLPGVVSQGGPGVASVEYVTIPFGSTDLIKTVNLTKGQNINQCVPFVTTRATQTQTDFRQLGVSIAGFSVETYSNGGIPAIRVQRGQNAFTINVHIYIVEFTSKISVTKGTKTLSGPTANVTQAISEVDLQKSFLVTTYRGNIYSQYPFNYLARVRFNSTLEVGFNRNTSKGTPSGDIIFWYYIVTDTSGSVFTVQTFERSMGVGVTTANDGIAPVVMSKTMVLSSCDGASNTATTQSGGYSYLQSSTNVRTIRESSVSNTDLHTVTVISFLDGTTVQRGIKSTLTGTSNTNVSEVIAIASVDTDFSIAHLGGGGRPVHCRATTMNSSPNFSIEVTAGGASITLRFRAGATSSTVEHRWEVISFAK